MGKKNFESVYGIYDEVYIITDSEQKLWMVTGILFQPKGVEYRLQSGNVTSWNFAGEISSSKSFK